ncbi:MAG: hypothetical protein HYY37_05365 [Candidatus Aenigmarchaeota archaeon]|nr:hypothetical protein [Candidatus Aenigmarchaeota archaeon]
MVFTMNRKFSSENVFIILVALVVAISVINVAILFSTNAFLGNLIKAQEEEARAARLEAISIVDSSCADCYAIATMTNLLRKENVNITSERMVEFSSAEGRQLVQQHAIPRIPALVLKGEANKTGAQGFVASYGAYRGNDTAVVTNYDPPYYDVGQQRVVGRITATHVTDPSCPNCTSLAPLIDALREAKVAIAEEKSVAYSSPEGQQLIAKFAIQHVPAVIISKDITAYQAYKNLPQQLNATEKEGFYALHATRPPYRSMSENRILGMISLTTISDHGCRECSNVTLAFTLRQLGAFVSSEKTVDYNSTEGKALASLYGITTLPSMLVSNDVDDYANLKTYWATVNKTLVNGTYAVPSDRPPYVDLQSGAVKGLVTVIYLSDAPCTSCYPVTNHRFPLSSFSVYIMNETMLDVSSSEGKALIAAYNITRVPTILLSPDVDAYRQLQAVWIDPASAVGTIAPDGWYVFTATQLMGTYKDLATGQVVTAHG